MSLVSDYLPGACANLQTGVNAGCSRDPRTKQGFSQQVIALSEQYNPFGVTFDSATGKERIIDIKYSPRVVDNGNYDDIADICNGATVGTYNSISVEANLKTSVEEEIPFEDIRVLCENPSEFRGMRISKMFNAMMEKVNHINLTYIDTITPYLINGGAGQFNIDLVVGSSGARTVNSEALVAVLEGLADIGCGVEPVWVGNAAELVEASYLLNVGCCNTNSGIDLSQINGQYMYFKDNKANSILGTGHTIAMIPGSIIMMPWYRNVGEYAGSTATTFYEVITDPITGMQYDLTIREVDCPTRKIVMQLSLHWHLWTLPDDYYLSGDSLYQTKGFLRPVLT